MFFTALNKGDTKNAERDAAQITLRQECLPYVTHFVLCAEKKRTTARGN
jgi:hypothetical protein